MPERVTKEERTVSLAIEKARKAKELLQQESVHERLPLKEPEMEKVKVKRPKATNVKVTNQTQKTEGYGLAGETIEHKIKKQKEELDARDLFEEDRIEDMEKDDLVEYAKDKVEGFNREELIKFMKNW